MAENVTPRMGNTRYSLSEMPSGAAPTADSASITTAAIPKLAAKKQPPTAAPSQPDCSDFSRRRSVALRHCSKVSSFFTPRRAAMPSPRLPRNSERPPRTVAPISSPAATISSTAASSSLSQLLFGVPSPCDAELRRASCREESPDPVFSLYGWPYGIVYTHSSLSKLSSRATAYGPTSAVRHSAHRPPLRS